MTTTRPTTAISTRTKVTAAVFVVIVIFLLYEVFQIFKGGGDGSAPVAPAATSKMSGTNNPMNAQAPSGPPPPQAATLTPATTPTARDAELMRLQQATESKYLSAVNDLQMLKVEKDIAETNKAIMSARYDTITAEKNIVNLLKPPPTPTTASYAPSLVTPGTEGTPTTPTVTPPPTVTATMTTTTTQTEIENYQVISVSLLNNRWGAVLGLQGNLFSVQTGDVLPADRSKVVSIDKTGVILENGGKRKKFSLVPII